MSIFQAIFLGVLQGLTEFLPVSSTGHLVALSILMDIDVEKLDFIIMVHLGTLVSICVFFWKEIIDLLKIHTLSNKKKILYIIIATIPAGIIGISIKDWLDSILEIPFISLIILTFGWLLSGIYLISSRLVGEHRDIKIEKLGWKRSIIIGLSQALAIIPGVSRSGMTVVTGLFTGLKYKDSATFSFFLAIPVIGGSGILLLKDVILDKSFSTSWMCLMTGFIASFISGYLALSIFIHLLERGRIYIFGYYCIVLSIIAGIVCWI